MNFKLPPLSFFFISKTKTLSFQPKYLMASTLVETLNIYPDSFEALDDLLSSDRRQEQDSNGDQAFPVGYSETSSSFYLGSPGKYLSGDSRIERAWAYWTRLGRPKLIVAPMVDNSELPFRMLCPKYGAQAAYNPMLHSLIFTQNEKNRNLEFTTSKVLLVVSIYTWLL